MTSSRRQDGEANERKDSAELRRERLLAGALAEFHDLRAREDTIDVESFCQRHPSLARELRAELETIDRIDAVLETPAHIPAQEKPAEELPERLSGHRILGVIGAGGMGRVLLAHDEALGRKVAIKTLSTRLLDNELLRTRFMHEARAMARLSHSHVVRIYNLGPPNELPHFVMEYVEGAPLVEAAHALTLDQKVELVHKVILAVDFLHQNQIIHRDLKPGNILVGPDLEPKLLDFGLAQLVDDGKRLTLAGEVMGTPDYFSPEQATGEASLDARSDVFSLGTILYELLTGAVPFRSDDLTEQIRMICERDPVLPRRLEPAIPGELQNICLKALEKTPAHRYGSAGEMARDLERFLAGEPVLASPTSYSRLMGGKIDQHMRELKGWLQDRVLSEIEFDSFRKLYERLIEREDAWIMEVRRLSLAQVALYLGAWVLVVGAALLLLFRHAGLSGTTSVVLVSAVTAPIGYVGIRCWKQGRLRIAIAYLLAFCLLLPTTMLVAMKEWGLATHFSQGKKKLEFFSHFSMFYIESVQTVLAPDGQETATHVAVFHGTTNAQLWWALTLSLPVYFWLRRFTKASVFSLVFSVATAVLCLVTLLRMGLIEWLIEDPGKIYFRLMPFAILFFAIAAWIERLECPSDSRYFYPVAVAFTFIAFSGVAAFHEPYARWLESVIPRTRGQIEYLFILNAAVYLALQSLSERFGSAQMRWVAKSFRFVIPGHVMVSLLLLGLAASGRWEAAPARSDLRFEARAFEVILPVVASLFVFGSVPKQMKNFFASGLLFLAIGLVRLQLDLFQNRPALPISLLLAGIALMVLAANYTPIKLAVTRWLRR